MSRTNTAIIGLALAAVAVLAVFAVGLAAQSPDGTNQMLSGQLQQATPTPQQQPGQTVPGQGWMDGYMLGPMTSMRGGPYFANASPLTKEDALQRLQQQLATFGDADFEVAEIQAYSQNFYAPIRDTRSGQYVFQMIVDRYTGIVMPEPGPNMAWNTQYGMMGGHHGRMPGGMMGPQGQTPPQAQPTPQPQTPPVNVSVEQGRDLANQFLAQYLPAHAIGGQAAAGDTLVFPGYYTYDVVRADAADAAASGQIGMVSVNSFNGAVWYHTWHGQFFERWELAAGQ